MSYQSDGKEKASEEAQKAKRVIDKDVSNSAENATQKASRHEEPRPFHPNGNVDNQQTEKTRPMPSHNTSSKETPIQGTQLTKEKKAHKKNINEKADKATPKDSK